MLLANITVAKKIVRHFPTLSVLRKHAPPSRSQFAPFISAASTRGININIDTSKLLAQSLDNAEKNSDCSLGTLLRILSTRCMMPAQYVCTGDAVRGDACTHVWHHYGLAAPIYTHFTSPIRRYADVCVHRLLAAAIGVSSLPTKWTSAGGKKYVTDLCTHMNRRHRAAQYAQRASVTLHTLMYFKNKPSQAAAFIMSVQSDRVSIHGPEMCARKS
jgi:exosome complex exonuclease DIS3/RRP44